MALVDGLILFNAFASIEFIVSYASYRGIKNLRNYKIKKELNTKDISKVVLPEGLKQSILESNDIKREAFKKAAIEFAEVLIQNFSEDVLANFYNNIKTVKIKNMSLIEWITMNASGYYSFYDPINTIAVTAYSSLFHELFHLASTYNDEIKKVNHSGFETNEMDSEQKLKIIGVNINEGYTELLVDRYFKNRHKKIENNYVKEVHIVKHLENIVGKDKMEQFYLTANQKGLLEEMGKYSSVDEALDLIKEIDNKKRNLTSIYSRILKMYNNKLIKQIQSEEITTIEAVDNYLNFEFSLLGYSNTPANIKLEEYENGLYNKKNDRRF